jgi:ferredoxin
VKDDSYVRLARALDVLPSGFPQTRSHVELKLIEKAFTPEEAGLAGEMTRTYETPAELAARTGMSEPEVKELLRRLLPRRLVQERVVNGSRCYRLGPFVVGWYEAVMEGLMRHDAEFARLFEQYMIEGAGERIMAPRPGIMGVVPARGSLRRELLQPYEDIDAHFARHDRFGVVDCACQIERSLVGNGGESPRIRCGFVGLPPETPLSDHVLDRAQALTLFTQLEDQGNVHAGFYGFTSGAETPQFVGCCNCRGDCCTALRVVNEFGLQEGLQRSNYRAFLHEENCLACGLCLDRCQVHAISDTRSGVPVLNRQKCIGCGQCVIGCPGDVALELVPVSREEWFQVPSSFEEWEERRIEGLRKAGR